MKKKPMDFSAMLNSKKDYTLKANQEDIEKFIQKYHSIIISEEFEKQKKEYQTKGKKLSLTYFCENILGISKNTFYSWRDDKNVTLKTPAFEVLSKTETFKNMYHMSLCEKLLNEDSKLSLASKLLKLIEQNPEHPIWHIIDSSFAYIEHKGYNGKWNEYKEFFTHVSDLIEEYNNDSHL